MGYQRQFDPEIAAESVAACVNDSALLGASAYALAVSNLGSASVEVPPGLYRVFLAGMSASESIALKTGNASVAAVFPSAGTPEVTAVFPGNAVERVRVLPGATYVAARTAVGGGTLYLVPVVML